MTQDEIIEMAKEAGLTSVDKKSPYLRDCLKRFAKLVAAKEREACAELCENFGGFKDGHSCADAIRARGEA